MAYTMYETEPIQNQDWVKNSQISWWHVPIEHGNVYDINEILDALAADGYKKAAIPRGQKTITSMSKLRKRYFYSRYGNAFTLYWYEEMCGIGECYYRPHRVSTTASDPLDENQMNITGYMAMKKVKELYATITHKSFARQFGGEKEWAAAIKRCVCSPICYPSSNGATSVAKHYTNVYKTDISSAYPYEGSKKLPTLQGAKKVSGRVAPTAEFPFAFYTKSCDLAIFGEFDTDDMRQYRKFYPTYFESHHDVREDETILCPAAEYDLNELFYLMYSKRKTNPEYKSYMNLFIGFCQRNDNPEFAHIAAVVLARCVMRVLRIAAELEKRGNKVILIATDAVAWTGKAEPDMYCLPQDKSLGALVLEHENIEAYIKGSKCYQLLAADGSVKTFWAGVKKARTKDLAFGEINTSPMKPLEVAFDENKQRFIDRETLEPLVREL